MMICPVCAGYGQNAGDEAECKHCLGWGVMLHSETVCSNCKGRVQAPMWCAVCKNTGITGKVKPLTHDVVMYSLPAKKLREALTKLRVGYDRDDKDKKSLGLLAVLLDRSADMDGHPIQKWLKAGQVVVEPSGIWIVKGQNGVRIHEFEVEYI